MRRYIFGGEYTLVAVATICGQILRAPHLVMLSSSRALKEIVEARGCSYFASAVDKVSVVNKMKEVNAVIRGRGVED